MYQIGESNRIEKIDSVARIESNRNFFARIGMLWYIGLYRMSKSCVIYQARPVPRL